MKIHISYISAIVILIGIICFLLWLWNGARIQSKQKDSVLSEKSDSIRYHLNKLHQLIAEKNAALIDLANFKKSYPDIESEINKRLGIKTKNLLAAYRANFKATGHGQVPITDSSGEPFLIDGIPLSSLTTVPTISDSLFKFGKIVISDGYLNFTGTLKRNRIVYDYDYSDTLLLSFSKNKNYFKGTTIIVSGVLSNKNAKIIHKTGILIQTVKLKRFNISVGVYYDPFRQTFGPAVTAGYALVRF